jgi:hypothetical protein
MVHTVYRHGGEVTGAKDLDFQGAAEFMLAAHYGGEMDTDTYQRNIDFHAPLNLPFERCFFSAETGGYLLVIPSQGLCVRIRCIFVQELEPGKYMLATMSHVTTKNKNIPITIHAVSYDHYFNGATLKVGTDGEAVDHYEWYYSLVHWCCGVIEQARSAEVERNRRKQKIWSKGSRTVYKPSHTIYLGPRSSSKAGPKLSNVEFKRWIDAWRVRGHWRKLNGSTRGKDRRGDRTVEGYTWVRPHLRGDGMLTEKRYKVR